MQTPFSITREKHLDHMVKVVPLIVVGYAAQCYMIMQFNPGYLASNALLFLGCCLGLMIAGFITYDLKHRADFSDTHVKICFAPLAYEKVISFHDILEVKVTDPGQTFATITIRTKTGKKHTLFFADEADKVKKWLDEKCAQEIQIAA